MTATDPKLIAALLTAKAALESALLALATPQPEPVQAPPASTPAVEAGPCTHEHRKQQKTFGSTEHWICEDCGYEYRR